MDISLPFLLLQTWKLMRGTYFGLPRMRKRDEYPTKPSLSRGAFLVTRDEGRSHPRLRWRKKMKPFSAKKISVVEGGYKKQQVTRDWGGRSQSHNFLSSSQWLLGWRAGMRNYVVRRWVFAFFTFRPLSHAGTVHPKSLPCPPLTVADKAPFHEQSEPKNLSPPSTRRSLARPRFVLSA